MATYNNMHKTFKGTVGNLVGSKWRGKSVLRSKPESVANPNTDKQQAHRLKFKMLSAFLREVQPFLEVGFKGQTVGKSAHNAAMSANLVDGFEGTYPDLKLHYPDLVLAFGPLRNEKQLRCTNESSLMLIIEWVNTTNRTRVNTNDQLIAVAFNETQNEAMIWLDGPTREAKIAEFELPEDYTNDVLHVWAAFVNKEQSYSSTSAYLGEFIIQ